MAQSHIDQVLADLSVGATAPVTLAHYGLDVHLAQLLAIPPRYKFLPAGSYCPQSDVPAHVRNVGVSYSPGQPGGCCIAIDNGMCLAVWLLEE